MKQVPKGRHLITVGGHKKLVDELAALTRQRGDIADNIRKAKAHGDLSENFEYHEAKREQGFVEGRVAELRHVMPIIEIVEPHQVVTDYVSFGTCVRLRDPGGSEHWEIVIVGPLEAEPLEGRVSYATPMGEALWGSRIGEIVHSEAPSGRISYEILDIWAYQE